MKKLASICQKNNFNLIRLRFPFTPSNLEEVKQITGRIWNKNEKFWTVPLTSNSVEKLENIGYRVQPIIKKFLEKQNIKLPDLKIPLFEYQKDGVKFTEQKNGRVLIADEMGLGKTIQAIAYTQLHSEDIPILVVCPASLKLNWEKEFKKWTDITDFHLITGKSIYKPPTVPVYVINYDILEDWKKEIIKLGVKIIILDEVHYIKNYKANRTKATIAICKKIQKIIALSGTPIENRPAEIYNIINILNPTLFKNKYSFLHRYCGPENNGFAFTFNGATNTEELNQILTETIMIRRKKIDVLKDLPDKIFSFVPFAITNRKEYQFAENDFRNFLKQEVENNLKNQLNEFMKEYGINSIDFGSHTLERLKTNAANKANILSQMEKLKQLAVKGKLSGMINWIKDFLESGEKLVFFCEHIFVIDELMKEFKGIAVKIDGSVSMKNRNIAVDQFQNNKKIRLFVGNKAAQEGLTLTASSNVVIGEYPWTPGALHQRIDRVHRIGQKYTVNVYYMMALSTIEETIAETLDGKMKIISGVIDGENIENSDNLFSKIMNKYS